MAEKVDEAALKKVSADASRETGDARKAVELPAKAVEVAEEDSGYLGLDEVEAIFVLKWVHLLFLLILWR
jgi:cell division control protein 6